MGNTKNKQKRARLVFKSLAERQPKFVSNVKSFEVQRRRENAWERQRWCKEKVKDVAKATIELTSSRKGTPNFDIIDVKKVYFSLNKITTFIIFELHIFLNELGRRVVMEN